MRRSFGTALISAMLTMGTAGVASAHDAPRSAAPPLHQPIAPYGHAYAPHGARPWVAPAQPMTRKQYRRLSKQLAREQAAREQAWRDRQFAYEQRYLEDRRPHNAWWWWR